MFGLELLAALVVNGGGCKSNDPDTDGDGISDQTENTVYDTSPFLADTDGDGWSDYAEIFELGFDPDNYPLRFNPRVADIPELGLDLVSTPEIVIVFTDARGVSRTLTTTGTHQVTTTDTVSSTTTDSRSDAISTPDTATQTTVLTGPVDAGPTTRADTNTVSATFSPTTTVQATYAFTKSDALAIADTFAQADAYSEAQTITDISGLLKVTVVLENHGHLGFSIPNLVLGATVTKKSSKVAPVGNLVTDTPYLVSEPVALAPGQSTGPVVFIRTALPLSAARALLADASTLVIQLSAFQLDDADGKPFETRGTDIVARTALVLVDYGGRRPAERHFVATNVHGVNTITAAEALADVLHIPFAADPTTGLTSVHGLEANASGGARWTVQRTRGEGVDGITTPYDVESAPYDFAGIELRSGDVLALKLVGASDASSH